jgi:GDP-L-fucose synthase
MDTSAKIYVAGHKGMVGSAIVRQLEKKGFNNLLFADKEALDLRKQQHVNDFFNSQRPDYVFLAAAKVGGILANSHYPAEFIYDNLAIQTNVIHAAYQTQVKKLLFLGSSCIYPKFAQQPIPESALLTGPLEVTNEAYAVAKIAGVKMCQAYRQQYNCNFISAMPTNLYGINDNYHPEHSHVLPAFIRRFHEAKVNQVPAVTLWGTGKPLREFMFADDLAEACIFLMEHYNGEQIVNIGSGEEISISQLAQLVSVVIGYKGTIHYDTSKPDGTPRKLLDSSLLQSLGFKSKTSLSNGIHVAYQDYLRLLHETEIQQPTT